MPMDHDLIKKRLAGARGGSGWKPKDGDNRLFIMPPHSRYLGNYEEMADLSLMYKLHYFKIEGRPTEVSRCLEDAEKEHRQRCPACITWSRHSRSDDMGLKKMATDVGPKDSYLFNIIDPDNPEKGIQKWASNWTCWVAVMEIAANSMWGDIVDPENGILFKVKLTPGKHMPSGFNSYNVQPDGPQRVSMMAILNAAYPDGNWHAVLDSLEQQKSEYKTTEEIQSLLDEIGFPQRGTPPSPGGGTPAPVAPAPAPTVSAAGTPVIPAGVSAPVAPAPAPAAPVAPAPAPVAPAPATPVAPAPAAPVAPAPVDPAPSSEGPVGTEPPLTLVPAGTGDAIHYDPGPDFTPVAQIPWGAPRCFGAYDPKVHQCGPCPVMGDCQIEMLGVSG